MVWDKQSVSYWMLREMRGYVITKIKAPLQKALVLIGKRYPEPTRENTHLPNTHILLDLRDKFKKYEDNPYYSPTRKGRQELFDAIWKIFIDEYEHDIYYRTRIDWIIEEIVNSEWKPRDMGYPNQCWNEPHPYGGGYLIKDETLLNLARRFEKLEVRV